MKNYTKDLDKKDFLVMGIPYNPVCPVCKHFKSLHHVRLENPNAMVCFGNAFEGKSCNCSYFFAVLDVERQQKIRR